MKQTHYSWLAMFTLLVVQLNGQPNPEHSLNAYFSVPHAIDSLVYQSNLSNETTISVAYRLENNQYLQRSSNAQLCQNLVSGTQKHIQLSTLGFGTNQKITFPSPVTMIPGDIQQGDRHTTKASFEYQGRPGMLSLTVQVLGHDFADTPLQNFHNCLVVLVRMSATMNQGTKLFQRTTKGWYYPEIGLVKMALKETVNQKAPTSLTLSLKSLKYRGAWKESLHSEDTATSFVN